MQTRLIFFSKQDNVICITSVFLIKIFFSVCFHLWCLFPTLFVFYRQGKCKDMWFPWDTITSPLSLGGEAGVLKRGAAHLGVGGWGIHVDGRDIFPNSSGGKGGKAGLPFLPSLGHPASSSRVSCSGKVRKSSRLLPKETVAFFRSSAVSRETWERSSFGSLVTVPSRGGLSPSSHATNGKDDEKRFLFIENTHTPKYLL